MTRVSNKKINSQLLLQPPIQEEIRLNEAEAENLAEDLKVQLKEGGISKDDNESISLMIAGLGDKRGLLRRTFSKTLANIGKKAVPFLLHALHNHSDVTVRRAAAKTLRLIEDPITLPHLLEVLKNDLDPVVQGSAAAAMCTFGAEAVELFLEVFIDPESTPMQAGLASWGIAFIGKKAPRIIRKAAISTNNEIRAAAIAALADQINSLEDNEARLIVINSLDDESSDVRSEATILIGELNDKELAEPLLRSKLLDQNVDVRKNAALALMKLKAKSSLKILKIQKRRESNEVVARIIALAIGQIEKDL